MHFNEYNMLGNAIKFDSCSGESFNDLFFDCFSKYLQVKNNEPYFENLFSNFCNEYFLLLDLNWARYFGRILINNLLLPFPKQQ